MLTWSSQSSGLERGGLSINQHEHQTIWGSVYLRGLFLSLFVTYVVKFRSKKVFYLSLMVCLTNQILKHVKVKPDLKIMPWRFSPFMSKWSQTNTSVNISHHVTMTLSETPSTYSQQSQLADQSRAPNMIAQDETE